MNFVKIFGAFSKFGNSQSDGTTINLSQADKWMKQAGVINKSLTTSETAIHFNKFKTRNMDYEVFEEYLLLICQKKNLNVDDMKKKLVDAGLPRYNKPTKIARAGGVNRLTDTSKYTGTHRLRFDDLGKGRGIIGRRSESKEDSGFATKGLTNKYR